LDNVAWMTKLHVAISLYKDQSVFHRHSE